MAVVESGDAALVGTQLAAIEAWSVAIELSLGDG